MRVCIVGLGNMGSSLARRLSSKGYQLVLYNRTLLKAIELSKELGVEYTKSPCRCSERSDVVAIFVSDDDALLDVLLQPSGICEGVKDKVVINMSTVGIATTVRAKNLVENAGGRYLEAPVFGSVSEVLEGKLLTLVAGDEQYVNTVMPILRDISKEVLYVGPVPNAMVLKLAVNQLNHFIAAGFAETLAFVELYGVDLELLRKVLEGLWMKCIAEKFWQRMVEGMVGVRFRLELAAKDLQCFVESARRIGLDTVATSGALQRLQEGVASGYMGRDYTQIGRLLLERARKLRELMSGGRF